MAVRKALVSVGGTLTELGSGDTLSGQVSSADITTVVSLTQAAYDALGTPDANTLYLIEGATGFAAATVSTTAPDSPVDDQLWVDTN